MLIFIFILYFASSAHAQTLFSGGCPDVKPITDFNPKAFSGTWYVQYTSYTFYRFTYHCEVHNYTLQSNGTGRLDASALVFGYELTWDWIIESVDPLNKAKWNLYFPALLAPFFDAPVWVLDTDYISYAAIWNCADRTIFDIEYAWLLTRDRHASDDVIAKAKKAYDQTKFDADEFFVDDQKDCTN